MNVIITKEMLSVFTDEYKLIVKKALEEILAILELRTETPKWLIINNGSMEIEISSLGQFQSCGICHIANRIYGTFTIETLAVIRICEMQIESNKSSMYICQIGQIEPRIIFIKEVIKLLTD
jgi:hypothetical protein